MNATLRIKICGITTVEDALGASLMGADMVGLNFVPGTPRYLNPYAARQIASCLPPFVVKVGVFADEEPGVVNQLADFVGLDMVQLHGDEEPGYCSFIRRPLIKAVRVASARDLEGLEEYRVHAFVLDAAVKGMRGGTGRTFDWELAASFCRERQVLVAGGLNPGNVARAVHRLRPFGVDVSSGVESAPGRKEGELMRDFIQQARCAAVGRRESCHAVAYA